MHTKRMAEAAALRNAKELAADPDVKQPADFAWPVVWSADGHTFFFIGRRRGPLHILQNANPPMLFRDRAIRYCKGRWSIFNHMGDVPYDSELMTTWDSCHCEATGSVAPASPAAETTDHGELVDIAASCVASEVAK